MITNDILRDVGKEFTERVPILALMTKLYFVSWRFLVGVGMERDVNRHYGVGGVSKRAKLRRATIVGDGRKSEIKKGSVILRVIGEMCTKVSHIQERLGD